MRFIENFIYPYLNLIHLTLIGIYIVNINVQHDNEYLLETKRWTPNNSIQYFQLTIESTRQNKWENKAYY